MILRPNRSRWCPDCKTALAEAEIEYAEDPCVSVYVKFRTVDDKGRFSALGIDPSKVFFVIWTTTTWTLPGNLAICLGPDFEYSLLRCGEEYYVMVGGPSLEESPLYVRLVSRDNEERYVELREGGLEGFLQGE